MGRTFRIFVSSTFSDMARERDALQRNVFPKLRQLCARRGFRFQAVDLRWGISEEAGQNQRTMHICLEELARCQRITPRPNFMVLMGDRYGWRPLPAEIDAREFEAILALIEGPDLAMVQQWYHLDTNAQPPQYVLQPRRGEFTDHRHWTKHAETPLARILRAAVAKLDLPAAQREKYEASATEQEIIHGAFRYGAVAEGAPVTHAFAFLRNIKNLPEDASASRFRDIGDDGKPDVEAMERAQLLKQSLRTTLAPNVCEYNATWHESGPAYDEYLSQFQADVERFLSEALIKQMDASGGLEGLDEEIAQHASVAQAHARFFTGRADAVAAIDRYVSEDAGEPLVLHGESGTGKSALLGHVTERFATKHPKMRVVRRFIGATPKSTNVRSLLSSLCREMDRWRGILDAPLPADVRELATALEERLGQATADAPILLVLDALDQLSDEDYGRALAWLPTHLTAHARIIVSLLPGDMLENLRPRIAERNLLPLGPMPTTDARQLLSAWLADAHRTLQKKQADAVLDAFAPSGLPLCLRLAFAQAAEWHSYDEPPPLPSTPKGFVESLLTRLCEPDKHGEPLVKRMLGYLAASRHGLSEDELLDLLCLDAHVMEHVLSHARHALPDDDLRLPFVLWSRLYSDLQPYLVERVAENTTLIAFAHRLIGEALVEMLAAGQDGFDRHYALGAYFEDLPLRPDGQNLLNLRKLAVLPYHQAHAEMWPGLRLTIGNLDFLQAKAESGMAFDVVADFERVEGLAGRLKYDAPEREDAKLYRRLAGAFGQELHTVLRDPANTAQQLYSNCYALQGADGGVGQVLAKWTQTKAAAQRPWLRRLNVTPQTTTSPSLRRTLAGHRGAVLALAISADGETIASAGTDGMARIWRVRDGANLVGFAVAEGPVTAVALADGGALLITASRGKEICLWDARSGRRRRAFAGHALGVRAMRLSADERHLVTASDDKTVRIWEIATGNEVRVLRDPRDRVMCLDVDAKGHIAAGGEDQSVKLWTNRAWDPQQAARVAILRAASATVRAVALSADGAYAVFGGDDRMIHLWNLKENAPQGVQAHRRAINCIAIGEAELDRDENGASSRAIPFIVSGGDDEVLRLWDRRSLAEIATLRGHIGAVRALALPRRGTWCASAGEDGTVRIWDLAVRSKQQQAYVEHKAQVTCLTSVGEAAFASGSADNTLRLWEAKSGSSQGVMDSHLGGITCATSPSPTRIVTGSRDHTLVVWDPSSKTTLRLLGNPLAPALERLRDQGNRDVQKMLAGVKTGGHRSAVNAVATVSATRVVSAGQDGTLRLWDIETGAGKILLDGGKGPLHLIAADASSQMIASAGASGAVLAFDLSGQTLAAPQHAAPVTALALGASVLVSAARDGTAHLSNLRTGAIQQLRGHAAPINSLALDAQSGQILAGGKDGQLHLWKNGRHQSLPLVHRAPLQLVAFTRDGRQAVSVCEEGYLAWWEMANTSAPRATFWAFGHVTALALLEQNRVCLGTRGGGLVLLQLQQPR